MAGTGRADFAGLSSLSLLEGSAPSGEAQVRERESRASEQRRQLDGQMQRRPEVGASPCSLSALAAFFKLIETRLALDQPATRFTLWFRVRDGGLALFARRHIVKPHAPSGGSLSASLQQSGSPDSREAAGCPAA